MKKLGVSLISLSIAASIGFGSLVVADTAKADWTPRKPIEFVIMAGKGGGADKLARFIQSLIEKHKISPKPFIPVNKGGGSGAEALSYLKSHSGDSYIVMATLNSLYTTPLRQPGLGVDIKNFTPITRMAEDTFQLWVNSDTNIKTVEDYVAAVKKAGPKAWKMGGTGKGAEDSLVTAMLSKKFGIKMTYIPYKGGGKVAKELIGKHINSTVNNPSEQLGFWDAGKSRPIAKIPTFAELGHGDDMVYYMQRSIIAPNGISADVKAFYVDVFDKVYKTKEWQEYMAKKGLLPGWLTGKALTSYFVEEQAKHAVLLKASGEIK